MRTRHLRVLSVIVLVVLVGGCSKPDAPASPPTSAGTQEPDASQTEVAEQTSDNPLPDSVVRYLALGDSLSEGNGAPDPSTGSFPAQLTEQWKAAGCEVELLNVSISGYTAAQVLSDEVPNIAEFQPTVITFQTGGNDIATGVPIDEFRANVGGVLDAATGSGADVYVITQPEWHRSPNAGSDPDNQRAAFDEVLIEEAQNRSAEFLDLRPLFTQQADANMWAEDGMHPNAEAYGQWATELADLVPAPCA